MIYESVFNELFEYHCPDCDGENGNHYPGCIYEGTDGPKGSGGGHRGGGGGNRIPTLIAAIGLVFMVFAIMALIAVVFRIDIEKVPAPILVIAFLIIMFFLSYFIYGRKKG